MAETAGQESGAARWAAEQRARFLVRFQAPRPRESGKENIMGLFEGLLKAAANTALIPLAAAEDVLTLGDGEGSQTAAQVVAVLENLDEATDFDDGIF